MKLYDFPFSSNCRKVRAVCYELGLPIEIVPVDLRKGEQRDAAFLALNPNGRVPVLVDDDFVLWESNAILGYLATKRGSLLPTEPRARADVDRFLYFQAAHVAPAVGKVAFELVAKKLSGRGAPDLAVVDVGRAEFAAVSRVFDSVLGDREVVAGELSIADFALAASYSLALDVKLDTAPFPRVDAWLKRMLARDSMRRALTEARTIG